MTAVIINEFMLHYFISNMWKGYVTVAKQNISEVRKNG